MAHTIFLEMDDSIVALDPARCFAERTAANDRDPPQIQEILERVARRQQAAVGRRSPVWLQFRGSVDIGTSMDATLQVNSDSSSSMTPQKSGKSTLNRCTTGSSNESTNANSGSAGSAGHDTMNTSRSSCSSDFTVPGLRGSFSETDSECGDKVKTQMPIMSIYNTVEAHENGTCRPCRFYHMKEEGCRLGDACKFCHMCTRDEARNERLRVKYDDRRRKRRQGIRK
eukprot:s3249_g8.t1